ncbi:MAG: hypothetical protein CM1200mP15_08040 [Dehalococcoidia bacterium]|nr:MAG: hypothetical protein CM1200mP15_08040 [Dehalococcoidia bacterium]
MTISYRPLIGTPMGDLDTPCLVVDMDNLDHNMSVMADYYALEIPNSEDMVRTIRHLQSLCVRLTAVGLLKEYVQLRCQKLK